MDRNNKEPAVIGWLHTCKSGEDSVCGAAVGQNRRIVKQVPLSRVTNQGQPLLLCSHSSVSRDGANGSATDTCKFRWFELVQKST